MDAGEETAVIIIMSSQHHRQDFFLQNGVVEFLMYQPVVEALKGLSELFAARPHGHPAEARAGPVDVSLGCDETDGGVARVILQLHRGGGRVCVFFGKEDHFIFAYLLAVRHLDLRLIKY